MIERNSIFRLAQASDDILLRRMLRENPVGGWVQLSYEREPSFFEASKIEGKQYQAFVVEDKTNEKLNALFSYSVRSRFVNSKKKDVSYLGQLRVRESFAGKGRLIRHGFQLCEEFLNHGNVEPYFFTTIISDNMRAKRVLTSNLKGMPTYKQLGTIVGLVCPTLKKKWKLKAGLKFEIGAPFSELSDFLLRNGKEYNFSPVWSEDALKECPGLTEKDFIVSKRQGRIVGCAAIWDQSFAKQMIVRGYHSPIHLLRKPINYLLPMIGMPRLPAIGEGIKTAFLSHFFVETEENMNACDLVGFALYQAQKRGLDALIIGMDTRHDLVKTITKNFHPIKYSSEVYAAHWPSGKQSTEELGLRLLSPEFAIL